MCTEKLEPDGEGVLWWSGTQVGCASFGGVAPRGAVCLLWSGTYYHLVTWNLSIFLKHITRGRGLTSLSRRSLWASGLCGWVVSVGERSQAVDLQEEVDAVAIFCIPWTLVCTQIPKKSFTTQVRLCQSHKADALESLRWWHTCQQHTFTQGFPCSLHLAYIFHST